MEEMPVVQVRSQGRGDPPKEEMSTHSSIFSWKIPWKRSLVGYILGGGGADCKESDMTEHVMLTYPKPLCKDKQLDPRDISF